jgi:organic radical activating enzyme
MIDIRVPAVRRNNTLIQWEVATVCNYSCSYCPEQLHNGKYRWPQKANVINFLNEFKQQHPERTVVIQCIGGEPTVWPEFENFVDDCANIDIVVNVTSNGSRTVRWWSSICNKLNKIALSLHWEQVDIDNFESVVREISKTRNVEVMIMAMPETFEKSIAQAEKFSRDYNNVEAQVKLCRVDFSNEYYNFTEQQLQVYKSLPKYYRSPGQDDSMIFRPQSSKLESNGKLIHFKDIVNEGLNRWKGYTCGAGIQVLSIDFAGNITDGTCHNKSYGNINTSWTVPVNYTLCNKDWCNCPIDIKTDKYLEQ